MLNARNGKLNDYYYGVRPDEATASRPQYTAGAGLSPEIGLYAAYSLTERWRVLAGYTVARWPGSVIDSPIVENRFMRQLTVGLMYDLSPDHEAWPEKRPLIVRAYNGDSTDCHVLLVAELRCTSTHTRDRTGVFGFELGRPFIDRVNGWPVDIAGFVGVQRHREAGFQPDFWSVRAYVKTYYYGFPWDSRVRTRVGLGLGLSYAQKIPLMEVRDLQDRGRNTSKILNTFDPTVDVSVGDLTGVKSLRETYVGFGVSHRSGIFGTSQLLGNVNGGSNYIYAYVETSI
jgi:outer membrane protein